ncbi:hypothetical protein J416_03016 [Gracilibacillus halophilus YIM-C55.5]|uniref:Uncharacterized protein n=1 Tax=Gracilibacillus halophilus YIM-C55.5 TaxID=1308866 RepID=N4WU50_9BACI|nr:extracellular solute-binding protein [Gracilibacillus halophilus]ENH97890.1 hypothetical protein J416_03016 [Gracilibacillus halophilus YIM-C55.5]
MNNKWLCVYILIIGIMMLSGCHASFQSYQASNLSNNGQNIDESQSQNNSSDRLVIWTPENVFEHSLSSFQNKYPELEVEIEIIDSNQLVNTYRDSIVNQRVPDVMVIPNQHLGSFSSINGLETLNSKPYVNETFFSKFPKGLLENHKNATDETMYAFPLLYFPYVTFYRADIMDKAGFPSDPDKLSEYLANVDRWLRLAENLKTKDQYMIQSNWAMMGSVLHSADFFDAGYNYLGDEQPMAKAIESSILATEYQLSPYLNIWEENGRQALQNDQLVMFHAPKYVQNSLKDWVPEQKGDWAITDMPFGLSGNEKTSSLSMAIPTDSDNKKAAWEFIRSMSKDMLNMYREMENDPFYRNENLKKTYWDMLSENDRGQPTPLDQQVEMVWEVTLQRISTNQTQINGDTMNQLHQSVNQQIRYDRRSLMNLYNTESTSK